MIKKFDKKFILFSVSLAFLFSVSLALPAFAGGASLYLSPSNGTYNVGNTFSVAVMVNTGGVAINAAEATLTFDAEKLEITNISKSGSIFPMWVENPSFSGGSVSFGGGLLTPGYNGSSGRIIIINFRAKSKGVAGVSFSSGRVLPNSPNPTNILISKGSGSYIISVVSPLTPVPSKPKIISSTHPDQSKWYKDNDPKFSWELPSGVTDISFSFDQKEKSYPDYVSEGLIDSKTYKDVKDGVWYFHLKFRNKNGWSFASNYKIQIDTTPPEPFKITINNKEDLTNPRPILLFETSDALSGIDSYEVKIGKDKSVNVKENSYQIPLLNPGKYTVVVEAIDKAGNYTAETIELTIEAIETPVITKYSKVLYLGDPFFLEGKSLPEIIINIYLQKEGEEEVFETTARSDKEGSFTYNYDRLLGKGEYKIWIVGEDSRGARSNPSAKISISVAPPAFIRIGWLTIDCLSAVIILLVVIAGLVLKILWRRKKLREKEVKNIREEREELEKKNFQEIDKYE